MITNFRRRFFASLLGAVLGIQCWAISPKISLDFDNTEAVVVLREIARLWGKPLKIDPHLHGKVSIHLHNVPAEEALRQVLAQLAVKTHFESDRLAVVVDSPSPATPRPNVMMSRGRGGFGREFNTESYKVISEHPFQEVSAQPLSTFSADVDTGSYSNLRRMLMDNQKPPADAVRIEEMLNYFSYDYAVPTGKDPLAITTQLARCPWDASHSLLQIGLRTAAPVDGKVPPRNLVFLVDVSGSMQSPDKLPLVQQALDTLVERLDERDHVALVVYAGSSGMPLGPTSGANKAEIRQAIRQLEAGGSTNGAGGILQAYKVAREQFQAAAVNRVILCSDGDFNVGVSSEGELVRLIEEQRKSGVYLSVLGFGRGNLKDDKMEQLADKGNGNYAYIDSLAEARKVLVSQAGGTLVTVAKDVKIQVEFNPAQVAGYRLLGYENRDLANQDFNNDAKDAGDMGQGHTVTALYELIPPGQEVPNNKTDPLRYQQKRPTSAAAFSGEVAHIKVRYKPIDSEVSQLLEQPVVAVQDLGAPQGDLAFAAAVAAFGMVLRDSPWKGASNYAAIRQWAQPGLSRDPEGYRAQFLDLLDRAQKLGVNL